VNNERASTVQVRDNLFRITAASWLLRAMSLVSKSQV